MMNSCTLALFVLSVTISMSSGCTALVQKNIDEDHRTMKDIGGGIIVGSVTAPLAAHYHKKVVFRYHSLENQNKHRGVLTSGTQFLTLPPWVPSCSEDGLDDQCGRLFAINLPAGEYVIDHIVFEGDHYQPDHPGVFSVLEGRAIYLGNLHVTYCVGLVRSTRGNILGADVSVRDNYERDTSLLTGKYSSLRTVRIERQLLLDPAWKWRVSYKPYSWGTCSATPNDAPKLTQ